MLMQSGGERYEIQTGRKDGLVSQASNVNLPSPSISVSDSIAAFATKGLTTKDMVLLLGTLLPSGVPLLSFNLRSLASPHQISNQPSKLVRSN